MIVEIGHFALILTLAFAVLQVMLPAIGLYKNNSLILLTKPLLWAQFAWLSSAFFILMYAFLTNDFSVLYVASNSNTELPTIYKIAAIWGAHEGSLLLWVYILVIWSVAFSYFSKQVPTQMLTLVLIILALITIGFLLFLVFTSNPFERIFPVPANGRELNPLLQDIGLALHPPMLYIGYVGSALPFALILSALIQGRLDSTYILWSRPWTLIAWAFLTIGIVLGSWWAYYELGWGGWWFWDPVENASFMPWLVMTALVHSLSVSEKRNAFKNWTVLLAIFAFSLSLLGTFLVRSGVITSVHAFATDPGRGLFILIFLAIVTGGSLILYALRASTIQKGNTFEPVSRESSLLINNILFVAAAVTVLLGTTYPIFLDALNLGKISVGPPYFNKVFVPIMILAVLVMALSPFIRWKKDSFSRITNNIKHIWVIIFLITLLFMFFYFNNISIMLAIFLFCWIIIHSVYLFIIRIKSKAKLPFSFIGMLIAHIGAGVFLLGASVVSQLSIEKDVEIKINKPYVINNYKFLLKSVKNLKENNYVGLKAHLEVYKDNKKIYDSYPEKRQYATGMPMTEVDINAGFFKDIYIALGEDLAHNSYSFRIYFKPFIRWIWLGGILIAIGALIAIFDRRYRIKITK